MDDPHKPKPTTVSSTAVQQHFGEIVRRTVRDGEHFMVERGRLPVMVIIPVRDYQELTKTAVNRQQPPDESSRLEMRPGKGRGQPMQGASAGKAT
jgi:prevent-host-death family protein